MSSETRDGGNATAPEAAIGLTGARTIGLERIPIRTRESGATLSGWRLEVAADQGTGAIHRIDAPGGATLWRGDGVFLGRTVEELSGAYAALAPRSEEGSIELHQLG